MSPLSLQCLGFAAASCTTVSFVPQVVRVWRTRSGADISAAMYALFIIGLMLWTIYGIARSEWPIIIANIITMGLAGAVLGMKVHFDRLRCARTPAGELG